MEARRSQENLGHLGKEVHKMEVTITTWSAQNLQGQRRKQHKRVIGNHFHN